MPCSLWKTNTLSSRCHQFFIVQILQNIIRDPFSLSFPCGKLSSFPRLKSSSSLVPTDDVIPRPTRRCGSPSQARGSRSSDEEPGWLRGAGVHGAGGCGYTAGHDGFLLVYGTGCGGYTAWNHGFLRISGPSRCGDAFVLLHRLVRFCVLGCRRCVEGLLHGVPGVPQAVVVVLGCGRWCGGGSGRDGDESRGDD